MKNLLILIVSIFILNTQANAQCQAMLASEYNKFEMTNTDKKGKTTGKSTYEVIARQGNSITYNMTYQDEKNKEMLQQDVKIVCDGDNIKMDMSNFSFNNSADALDDIDLEMEFENIDLEFPNNLSVGQNLPDAETVVRAAGMVITSHKMTNRKVIAKETLTTKAGSFECFKVSCENQSKAGFIKTKNDQTQWYCPEMGFVIKHETYSRDKLVHSSEITALK